MTWMYFNNDKARNFLLQHGYVYTIRKNDGKKVPLCQKVILRHHRDTIGNGAKFYVCPIDLKSFHLDDYLKGSGFSSSGEWIAAVMEFNPERSIVDNFNFFLVALHSE